MAAPASFFSSPGMSPYAETILVADDDEVIRRLCRRGLEADGAHVLEAENGEAALRLIAAYSGPIDLVITDLMMPGLNGVEVAEVLSVFRPGLPVLAMSGAAIRLKHDRRLPVLAKPFAIETLIEAAREARKRARGMRILTEEKRSLAQELRRLALTRKAQHACLAEQVDLVALAHELRKAIHH
jgi:CheY-like chemotaxis protein